MTQGVTVDFQANIARFTSAIDRATNDLNRFQSNTSRVSQNINNALGKLGIGLSVGAFAAFVKSSIDAADNINDLSQKIGISVENLAGYKLAAEQSGTSLEGMGVAAKKLNVAIAENNPLLGKLGITAKDANGAMIQLADVFGSIPDGAQKTAIAMKLMGKSGSDMIPLLNGGGAALEKMLEDGKKLYPVTTEMARAADQFNDSLTAIKVQASGAGISLANQLLPSLNSAFLAAQSASVEFGKLNGALVGLGQLGTIGQTVGVLWANVAYVFKGVGTEIGGIAAQLAALGSGNFKQAGIIGDMMKRDAVVARKEIDAIEKRIMGLSGKTVDAAKSAAATKAGKNLPSDLFGSEKAAKAAKDKLDILDPFGKDRNAAEKAALKALTDAQNSAFDDLSEMRDYQIAQDERAAAELGNLRSKYLDLIDPIQKYRDELEDIQKLQDAGLMSADQATDAKMRIQEQIDAISGFGEEAKKVASEMDVFFETMAKNVQSSLADFIFDPFADGVDGMLKTFGAMLQRMAAEAVAADITRAIFGDQSKSGASASMFSGMAKNMPSFGGSDQNLLGSFASLFGFAQGGSFTVGGAGGTDSKLVAFRATPGEEVAIRTPAQQSSKGGGNITVQMIVNTPDAGSFRKSSGQIQADLARAVSGARRFT